VVEAGSGPSILLASASPRRRELLDQIGVRYRVLPADIDESAQSGEAPGPYVLRVAANKVKAVVPHRNPGEIILGADTAVVLDHHMLGKPDDESQARAMLRMMSGRTHQVFTAVSVLSAEGELDSQLNVSEVSFAELADDWISAYVATGEPLDKAGAYGIQGWAGSQIQQVRGSYSSIMGLPLFETARLLGGAGLRLPQLPRS
jgi:septum formation protein